MGKVCAGSVHMYGTRRAADGWHCKCFDTLEEMGFQRGESSACVFWHKEKQLLSSVHGDDFTVLASEDRSDWFRGEISKRFEVKFRGRLGPEPTD